MLAYLKAELATGNDEIISIVKNTSCRLGIKNVELYYTNESGNIYALEDMRDSACVVIGREAFNHCSIEEITVLIFSALLKIKNNEIRFIQSVSLVPFMALVPRMIFQSILPKKIWEPASYFFCLYELPSFLFKKSLVDKEKLIFAHDDEVIRLTGAKELYASALFKMAQHSHHHSYFHQIIEDLAVAPDTRDTHIPVGVVHGSSLVDRYSRLQQ